MAAPLDRRPRPGATPPPAFDPLDAFMRRLHCQVRRAYAEAGAPFGPSDAAMLIWLAAQQQTRAN